MRSQWLSKLKGYVIIAVKGDKVEQFINEMFLAGKYMWDIKRTAEGMIACLDLADFFQIRPLLKKTGCRMRLLKKFGLPFFLKRLEKRKVFAAGMAGFVIGICLLSQLVWQVEVEGNERLSAHAVKEAAREVGIHKFQWKFKLDDPEQLAKNLQARLEDTSWIGVDIVGTNIHIKVVEAVRPEEKELLSPRHLVSEADAVITRIIAEKGTPIARVNAHVRKGDILISGIIGNENHQETVVAKGEVKGLVWHEYAVRVPLVRAHQVYTGEAKKRHYIMIGKWALMVSGFGDIPFEHFESDVDKKQLAWRNWQAPFGWIKETVRQTSVRSEELTETQARQAGIDLATIDLKAKYGDELTILDTKLVAEKVENEQLHMKLLFEIERDIATERPILQSEMAPQQEQQTG